MIRIFNIILLCFSTSLLFSGTDGTIRGQVMDVNGEPLPGVQILIADLSQGAVTDLDGNYIILNVQVGTYDIKASMIGYAAILITDVNITMDQTRWLNFTLQEQAIEGEVVEVTGERGLVEKDMTSKKITVSQEQIEALPIKDITELYSLQSGVVKVEGGMAGAIPDHEEKGLEEVHVRGGRSGEIAYMIDGLYIRNPIYGGIGNGTRLNLFAVSEFDWQPGGFNAEYGDAMSAVSNMHTAFGKDEFRYRFKYETSMIGAQVFNNEYDDLRGYNDYNLGFGGKIPFVGLIPFINSAHYWVSGQFTDEQSYRVLEFDNVVATGILDDDIATNVMPWDTHSGLKGFGFDKTKDIFAKISLKSLNNTLKLNYSYWQVAAHRQSFSTRYMYDNTGQNELFRDTYRHTLDINHQLTKTTFYSFKYSNFIQDQFIGVRWKDSDNDGYPDWFEYGNAAGSPINDYLSGNDYEMSSDPNNPYVTPFDPNTTTNPAEVYYTNKDGNGPENWTSGWYFGADPGNYNWDVAEEFIDVNQDGIYTPFFDLDGDGQKDPNEHWVDIFTHEHFTDLNGNGERDPNEDFDDYNGNGVWDTFDFDTNNDGEWEGPVLVEEAVHRDGSYWLTPEMYVNYEDYYDAFNYWNDIQNPYYGYVEEFTPSSYQEYYFLNWEEGRVFGGSDQFYSTSTARTNEYRIDLTSQLSSKWNTRVGFDYKVHKLNFYEIKNPWNDGSAIRQRFAEYWDDFGADGFHFADFPGDGYADENENQIYDFGEPLTEDYDGDGVYDLPGTPDDGEGNGQWDPGEEFNDFNGDKEWNDYVEPEELAFYWQNKFEVPWMVVNAGIRIDGVHYNTKIWADPNGDYSPYKPWMFRDCGLDGLCPDDNDWESPDTGEGDGNQQSYEEVTDVIGLPYSEVLFTNAKWLWKLSPRLGFSHVITDQATFTFNYGLYYQTPVYQNVYLNTNRADDPQNTFEESDGQLGNATMTASRTQSYEFGFNVQVNRNWAFSLMGWVKDMDQLVTAKTYRTGVYEYQVTANGDFGTATGVDFTLENRGLLVNTMLQYTYSVARANGEYDASAFGNQYVDAPAQQYLMTFDRTHDLTLTFYTFLPYGITASMTNFYQSGFPYTPYIFSGDKPQEDQLNLNSRRSPDWYSANIAFSKDVKLDDLKMVFGLNIYNVFNNRNQQQIWPLTGTADDPGSYYTDEIGVEVSSGYYDTPWYYQSPAEINFFMRIDFN